MLALATYNVNSIRARLDRVLAWLGRNPYDIVCLQELKVTDEQFPCAVFEAGRKLPSDHAPVVAAFNLA
jgi:exodeoxyribonuclease-3